MDTSMWNMKTKFMGLSTFQARQFQLIVANTNRQLGLISKLTSIDSFLKPHLWRKPSSMMLAESMMNFTKSASTVGCNHGQSQYISTLLHPHLGTTRRKSKIHLSLRRSMPKAFLSLMGSLESPCCSRDCRSMVDLRMIRP